MPVYRNRTIALKMPIIILFQAATLTRLITFFDIYSKWQTKFAWPVNELASCLETRVRCQYLFGDNSVLTMLTKQFVAGTSQQHAEQHADSDMT